MTEIPLYEDIAYFTYNDNKLAYKYFNKHPGKKTILMFYGFCGNINMLEYLSNHLKENFSVLAIDYPGHGYSPAGSDFSIDSFVTGCSKLIEFLKEEELILLGYSFGAIVGLNFYRENTEKVKKIVFLNSTACFCPDMGTKIFFKIFGFFIKLNFKFVINRLSIPLLCDKYTTREIVNTGRTVAMVNDKKSVIQYYYKIVFENFNSLLPLIECPVLVIGSKIDPLIPEKNTLDFAPRITNCRLEILKDIGHLSIVSKPDYIAKLMTSFLIK